MKDPNREKPLWTPRPENIASTNLTRYFEWLAKTKGLRFADYPALWIWSTSEPGAFWSSLIDFYQVRLHQPAASPLDSLEMPGARWFPGATLNYAEYALQPGNDGRE